MRSARSASTGGRRRLLGRSVRIRPQPARQSRTSEQHSSAVGDQRAPLPCAAARKPAADLRSIVLPGHKEEYSRCRAVTIAPTRLCVAIGEQQIIRSAHADMTMTLHSSRGRTTGMRHHKELHTAQTSTPACGVLHTRAEVSERIIKLQTGCRSGTKARKIANQRSRKRFNTSDGKKISLMPKFDAPNGGVSGASAQAVNRHESAKCPLMGMAVASSLSQPMTTWY